MIIRKFLILLVRAYQLATSTAAPRCKYYPSCSQYAITAIGRYGVNGVTMTGWRILRCNPWSEGGVDYVDEDMDSTYAKVSIQSNEKEVVGAN